MDGGFSRRQDLEPSDLDELSHAECLALYRESTDSIRYAKSLQWKTLGYLLAIFGCLVLIADTRLTSSDLLPVMILISFVVGAAGIAMLIIYQMWQSTEARKLDFVAENLSSLFRETRAVKSTLEANVHRYVLLSFMVLFILGANTITYLIIQRFIER